MRRLLLATGLALAAAAPSLQAADHQNLEELLPTVIEDAYPIPYRGREFQTNFNYERMRDGEDRLVLEPRLEVGLFRNFQAELKVPYRFGTADDAESGDVIIGGLYNFNQETPALPALSLAGEVLAPFGEHDEPWQTRITLLVTKTMPSMVHQRVHLNASWIHAYDTTPVEQDDRFAVALGYSVSVHAQAVLVLDVVHEEELREGRHTNLVEAGLRYQATPLTVLTFGGGAGLGDSETDVRFLVGFQHSLARLAFYE